jgi:hypothetical protein
MASCPFLIEKKSFSRCINSENQITPFHSMT